ncbi:MAG: tetratricopeptide repeat protein [Phycisphaerales bacterium]|nr:MAG: tetratricopeptide repeat protein [Phycisphaerales bacterium]
MKSRDSASLLGRISVLAVLVSSVLAANTFLQSCGSALAATTTPAAESSHARNADSTANDPSGPNAVAQLKSKVQTLIDELQRDFPQSVEPKVVRGMMYSQFGDYARAAEIWNQVLQHDRRRTDVLSNLGMVALEMGEYDKAVGYWRRALAVDPMQPGLRQDIGFAQLEAGHYDAAVKELQEELKLSPQSRTALNLLGQCYLQLKEYEKAEQTYRRVIDIDPKDADACYGLATVYMRLKQPKKAKEYMARFKASKQGRTDLIRGGYSAAYDLARMRNGAAILIMDASAIYRNHGNEKRADSLLEWAVRLDPKNVVNYMKRQVISHQMRQQHSQALALIERVAELEPDNADNYLGLAVLSLKVGRVDKAEAALERTVELAPELADGYRGLARLYAALGIKPRESLELASKAVELEGTAEDYFVLSRAYMNNDQMPDALSAMQKALELDPDNQLYRQACGFLKEKAAR